MICAFVALHPLAKASISRIRGVEFFSIREDDDQGYGNVLRAAWRDGRGFVNVEQDMEASQRHVTALRRCSEPWCVFPYNGPGFGAGGGDPLIYGGLGVVKFSAELIAETPGFLERFESPGRAWTGKGWAALDAYVLSGLRDVGRVPHVHFPPVAHHHRYRGLCACDREHEAYPVDNEGRYSPPKG